MPAFVPGTVEQRQKVEWPGNIPLSAHIGQAVCRDSSGTIPAMTPIQQIPLPEMGIMLTKEQFL